MFLQNQFIPQTSLHLTRQNAVPPVCEIPSTSSVVQSLSSEILSTSQPSNAAQGRNRWSSIETRILILSYQDHTEALSQAKSPQRRKAMLRTILQAFREIRQNNAIESVKTLTQRKEKWKSLFKKYKKITDNNKATGRGHDSSKNFTPFSGCGDKISPRYKCQTDICTDNPDKASSAGESTSPSESARSSNSDGEDCKEADDDKATQVKTPEGPPKKGEKRTADKETRRSRCKSKKNRKAEGN